MQEFSIDPLIAEELLLPSFRPKVERRDQVIYLILHFPTLHGTNGKHEQEIDFVIGKNFLITTRYSVLDPLHSFAKTFDPQTILSQNDGASHGGHLFTNMARSLYIALGRECNTLEKRLDDIEERIFAGEERNMVVRLSHIARLMHTFRQSLLAHDEMLHSLEPVAARFFDPEFSYHVHELLGLYQRIDRRLTHLRDSLLELRETNNSLLSTKQSEIMKNLTIMAFVTFPLTLISSLFGMNAEHIPIVGVFADFWIIIGIMLTIALSFFIFFKHKHWL